jgi:Family of unknown function (DUF6390)
MPTSGPVLFARYAYPPNELGYCGPEGAEKLLEHGASGLDDGDIAARARQFEGAWRYLELIAAAAGINDPLDDQVVTAYWVGNDLLSCVKPVDVLDLLTHLKGQVGGFWDKLTAVDAERVTAHHSFQVFAVYPWVGLLGSAGGVALSVLDQCRIRWGQIERIDGERALVRSRPLTWDGRRLALGDERTESVRWSAAGLALATGLEPGDTVALHWDWVCDRISAEDRRALESTSDDQLELTNTYLSSLTPRTSR